MNNKHFLTVEVPNEDGSIKRHKLLYDEESGNIWHTIDKVEQGSEWEEFYPSTHMRLSEFATVCDKWMCHPKRTWGNDEFVDELLSSYMFDELMFD